MKLSSHQKGFTIVELMIATTVFATVLLLATFGLLQVGRTYYKGLTASRTQEVARTIMEEVSQGIQFGGGIPTPLSNAGDGSQGICIGGKEFSYILNRQLADPPGAGQSRHVMVVRDSGACAASAQSVTASPSGRELVNTRMRLTRFSVIRIGTSDLYSVSVRVVSGDTADLVDLLPENGTAVDSCRNDATRSRFCSAAELSTIVQKRVK